MSVHTQQSSDELDRLQTLPTFELAYLFDDENDPETVTVFREGDERIRTYWITVDRTHAVALEDVA